MILGPQSDRFGRPGAFAYSHDAHDDDVTEDVPSIYMQTGVGEVRDIGKTAFDVKVHNFRCLLRQGNVSDEGFDEAMIYTAMINVISRCLAVTRGVLRHVLK